MRVVWGTVRRVTSERQGLQRLLVDVPCADIPDRAGEEGAARRAVCYPGLTGACAAGDLVALNTTACDLRLGTGGWDMVCAVAPGAAGAPGVAGAPGDSGARAVGAGAGGVPAGFSHGGTEPGHIMKLRYTPCQVNVAAVEEQGRPLHEALSRADDCRGMPVVCCELHSQAMAALAAIAWAEGGALAGGALAESGAPAEVAPAYPAGGEGPRAAGQGGGPRPEGPLRVAYIMTDEAALHLGLSDVCARLRAEGAISFTMTCGQAAGGEHEAVTLHSALLAARLLGAHAAVVSQGPGIVGTGTRFGHGGVAQGEAVNACAAVGARPVAALRLSFADARPRHRGLSHHSATALGRVALTPALVAMPDGLGPEEEPRVRDALASSGIEQLHRVVDVAVPEGALAAAARAGITTMGRGTAEDPAFFRAACAAGLLARDMARGQR